MYLQSIILLNIYNKVYLYQIHFAGLHTVVCKCESVTFLNEL